MSLTGSDRMNITKYTGMADKSGTYTSHFGKSSAPMRDPPWSTAHGAFSEHYTNKFGGITNDSHRTDALIQESGQLRALGAPEECPRGPIGGRQWLGEPTQKSSIMGSILAIPENDVYAHRGPGRGAGVPKLQ